MIHSEKVEKVKKEKFYEYLVLNGPKSTKPISDRAQFILGQKLFIKPEFSTAKFSPIVDTVKDLFKSI